MIGVGSPLMFVGAALGVLVGLGVAGIGCGFGVGLAVGSALGGGVTAGADGIADGFCRRRDDDVAIAAAVAAAEPAEGDDGDERDGDRGDAEGDDRGGPDGVVGWLGLRAVHGVVGLWAGDESLGLVASVLTPGMGGRPRDFFIQIGAARESSTSVHRRRDG